MDKLNFKKQIPNILTIFRILLTPVIIVLILVNFKPMIYHFNIDSVTISLDLNLLIGVIFFVIACISDFLDGYLSRKYNWISNFGKFWDPIADKILTNSVLFCLSSLGYIPIYFCLIFLIRDIIIEGLRINAIQKNIIIASNIWGKIKTILLMLTIVFIFFVHTNNQNHWFYWGIQNILIIFSIIFSIISLIIYSVKYLKLKQGAKSL